MSAKKSAALSAVVALAALLSACASGPETASDQAYEEKEIRTGSMIPRKAGASPTSNVSKDAFKDVRAGAVKDPMGGR
jgi:ABC-type phosphate/phosphonate transport system substrate-binding protein